MPNKIEVLAIISTFSSSSSSLSSTAHRPHHRLLTGPALGRSTRSLLPPPRAVSSSRAPLAIPHAIRAHRCGARQDAYFVPMSMAKALTGPWWKAATAGEVMTQSPECAAVDTLILDDLHTMHDGMFLHLPVLDKGMSMNPRQHLV